MNFIKTTSINIFCFLLIIICKSGSEELSGNSSYDFWDPTYSPGFFSLTDNWLISKDFYYPGLDSMDNNIEIKSGYHTTTGNSKEKAIKVFKKYRNFRYSNFANLYCGYRKKTSNFQWGLYAGDLNFISDEIANHKLRETTTISMGAWIAPYKLKFLNGVSLFVNAEKYTMSDSLFGGHYSLDQNRGEWSYPSEYLKNGLAYRSVQENDFLLTFTGFETKNKGLWSLQFDCNIESKKETYFLNREYSWKISYIDTITDTIIDIISNDTILSTITKACKRDTSFTKLYYKKMLWGDTIIGASLSFFSPKTGLNSLVFNAGFKYKLCTETKHTAQHLVSKDKDIHIPNEYLSQDHSLWNDNELKTYLELFYTRKLYIYDFTFFMGINSFLSINFFRNNYSHTFLSSPLFYMNNSSRIDINIELPFLVSWKIKKIDMFLKWQPLWTSTHRNGIGTNEKQTDKYFGYKTFALGLLYKINNRTSLAFMPEFYSSVSIIKCEVQFNK